MSENNIPLGTILDLAKNEIITLVESIMQNNHISPDIMIFILDSVSNDVNKAKNIIDSERYIDAMKLRDKSNGDKEQISPNRDSTNIY